jgi:hypothetical protein
MKILEYDVYNHLEEVIEVKKQDILPLIESFESFYHVPFIQFRKPDQMDDDKWEMFIVWDKQSAEEISNDIYYLIKGVRTVTLESMPSEFKHNIHNYIEDLGDGKDIKVYDWEDEDGYYRFFLYIDPKIKILLDTIKAVQNFNTQDFMIGMLLGYSNSEMGDYIQMISEADKKAMINRFYKVNELMEASKEADKEKSKKELVTLVKNMNPGLTTLDSNDTYSPLTHIKDNTVVDE